MGLLSGIANLVGALSPAHITFVTIVTGAKNVGTDILGNQYYRCKARKGYKHERRCVIYKGRPEASSVPPECPG